MGYAIIFIILMLTAIVILDRYVPDKEKPSQCSTSQDINYKESKYYLSQSILIIRSIEKYLYDKLHLNTPLGSSHLRQWAHIKIKMLCSSRDLRDDDFYLVLKSVTSLGIIGVCRDILEMPINDVGTASIEARYSIIIKFLSIILGIDPVTLSLDFKEIISVKSHDQLKNYLDSYVSSCFNSKKTYTTADPKFVVTLKDAVDLIISN